MNQSPQIDKLAAALVQFHINMCNIKIHKDSKAHTHKYANLSSILDIVRDPLSKNGLCIVQGGCESPITPEGLIEHVIVETQLIHESGQFVSSKLSIPFKNSAGPINNVSQSVGIAISYAKRYALTSMLGIAACDEDTDGNYGPKPKYVSPSQDVPPIIFKDPGTNENKSIQASEVLEWIKPKIDEVVDEDTYQEYANFIQINQVALKIFGSLNRKDAWTLSDLNKSKKEMFEKKKEN